MFERWQSLPPNKVKFDSENNTYVIPLDIGKRVDGNILASEKFQAQVDATRILFNYLGIPIGEEEFFLLSDDPEAEPVSFEGLAIARANVGESFTNPSRPEQNTRILITFDKDAIPREDFLESIVAEVGEEAAAASEAAAAAIISESFYSDEINSIIKAAQSNLRFFNRKIERSRLSVKGVRLDSDAEKLSLIVPKIKTFLAENNVIFLETVPQLLELQFDEKYKLTE